MRLLVILFLLKLYTRINIFSYKFAFIPFQSFHRHQKQESSFQQGGGLVTRNKFVFCLQQSRSTLEVCQIQQIFVKSFSYMLFLLALQLHGQIQFSRSIQIFISYSQMWVLGNNELLTVVAKSSFLDITGFMDYASDHEFCLDLVV